MANKRIDDATGVETVGHEWDGIEELNNPLPRWWLWTFYASIIFAVGYCIAYPALPLVNSNTKGLLGWSSRGQLAAEIQKEEKRRVEIVKAVAVTPTERLSDDPSLMRTAIAGGKAAFKVNCVQCHGAGAAGSKGYPNLNDDDWLWGGDLKAIEFTIAHGVRQPGEELTRTSQMPSFGRDGILTAKQIEDVTSYVRSLSGLEKYSISAESGKLIFAEQCVVCHGPAGRGNRQVGAPNLADAIWLYGKSREDVVESLTNAHYGVMPAWRTRLDPVTIKMLAAYVHSLGGGEAFTQPASQPGPADARP